MDTNEGFKDFAKAPSSHPAHKFLSPGNTIAIYTVLTILQNMQQELGLEAMLEYVNQYRLLIEAHNPKLKFAVQRALTLMSLEKMYKDAVSQEKK